MTHAIEWTPHADRALRKLPEVTQRRIVMRVETLAGNPYPRGSLKLERGSDLHRLRVGEHRVLYHVDKPRLVIIIVDVFIRERGYKGR
jgi:mRNA interferase RelE/StbE